MNAMRSERGYTLVEILIAFVILTFVITISFTAFLERNKRLQQANEIILAYQALSNESEYWRRIEFSALKSTQKFESDLTMLKPLTPYTTDAIVKDTGTGTRNVTLLIRWKGGQREAKITLVRVETGSKGGLW